MRFELGLVPPGPVDSPDPGISMTLSDDATIRPEGCIVMSARSDADGRRIRYREGERWITLDRETNRTTKKS